jgi:AcrR family transcriptional regulator
MPTKPRRKSTRGVPKGDKRARTRARLLEAARELVREKGYEGTTLRDVAERAGMTVGSIYGNFKNRDDLFIAMAETFWGPIKADFPPRSSFARKMRALADATIAAVPERRMAAVGMLSGRAYALTHEDVRKRAVAITASSYESGAAWVRSVASREELALPPDLLVRVAHVLTEGLLLQRFLTPELVPDEVFRAAFALLAVKRKRR